MTGAERPRRLEMLAVSSNYFSMLGTSAHIGRVFGPGDEEQGFADPVVISDSLWANEFGQRSRNSGAQGCDSTMIRTRLSVFSRPDSAIRAERSQRMSKYGQQRDSGPIPSRNPIAACGCCPELIGLLKPGISPEQAQLRLNAFAAQLRAEFPTDYPAGSDWSIEVESLQESLVGNVRPMLLVLMGAVVLIILLASVNVANLLLARASGRQREMAVRQAMGASRSRMIRQLLTESAILSLVSGMVGVLTAMVALHFVQFLPARHSPAGRGAGGLDGAGFRFVGFLACRAGVRIGSRTAIFESSNCGGDSRRSPGFRHQW